MDQELPRKVPSDKSLAAVRPGLAVEWDYDRNGDLRPEDVTPGSGQKVWWLCKQSGHSWQARVADRSNGNGCPMCSGQRVAPETSLAAVRPELAAEWDYDRNGGLRPEDVMPGSGQKVWWLCKQSGHSWQAMVNNRSKGSGCPMCSRTVPLAKSLATRYPGLAAEWDYDRNGDLRPEDVTPGVDKKVWWLCKQSGHSWQAMVHNRSNGSGCPMCSGQRVAPETSLAAVRPELAVEWDYERNGDLRPEDVTPGVDKKVWWLCKQSGHSWQARVADRSNGNGCPMCSGRQVTPETSLAAVRPELAVEWDYDRNGDLRPEDVTPGSRKKVWWLCESGHSWQAVIADRSNGNGCPVCSGRQVTPETSLAAVRPELAAEWDHERNGDLRPEDVTPGVDKKVWWLCKQSGHSWQAVIANRSKGRGCPMCSGRQVAPETSLAAVRPELAVEWDYERNGDLRPEDVTPGVDKKVWWLCKQSGHSWQAMVYSRSNGNGCPMCVSAWTPVRVTKFVRDLHPHVRNMDPVTKYFVLGQTGILKSKRGDEILKKVVLPKLPHEVDPTDPPYVGCGGTALGDVPPTKPRKPVQGDDDPPVGADGVDLVDDDPPVGADGVDLVDDDPPVGADEVELGDLDPNKVDVTPDLPTLDPDDELARIDELVDFVNEFVQEGDGAAVEMIIAHLVNRQWQKAVNGDHEAYAAKLEAVFDNPKSHEIQRTIIKRFLDEYREAANLAVPAEWRFRPPGSTEVVQPSLMQRRAAVMLRDKHCVGNWSGTGAGKTASAILGAAVSGTRCVLVVAPNSVLGTWKTVIHQSLPDQEVFTQALPDRPSDGRRRWVILNYEWFQTNDGRLEKLVALAPDLLILDEIHRAKERYSKDSSRQRKNILSVRQRCDQREGVQLRVLGMSATPLKNNLREAHSALELITGQSLASLDDRPTIHNAVSTYGHLYINGIRQVPKYEIDLSERDIFIPCPGREEDAARALCSSNRVLGIEQVFLQDKLDALVDECSVAVAQGERVLVYTQYVDEIVEKARSELLDAGIRVGVFTGEDKTGLDKFVGVDTSGAEERQLPESERVDVLIGSSAIGTGVDGLQLVTNKLIFLTMPWTSADYQQVLGRVYRQGQVNGVDVVVLRTYIPGAGKDKHGQPVDWSWDAYRKGIIRNKATLADATVDGTIPAGLEVTPEKAAAASAEWLQRLMSGEISASEVATLRRIQPSEPTDERRYVRHGATARFSRLNLTWNRSRSKTTHDKLSQDPSEWLEYHELYREARESWQTVPAHVMADWLDRLPAGQVVADLGCGEMLVANRCQNRHTIRGFDHVAVDERVTVCDISQVPLPDASVDIAILSLALMGSNYEDYLTEARRILKNGSGQL